MSDLDKQIAADLRHPCFQTMARALSAEALADRNEKYSEKLEARLAAMEKGVEAIEKRRLEYLDYAGESHDRTATFYHFKSAGLAEALDLLGVEPVAGENKPA